MMAGELQLRYLQVDHLGLIFRSGSEGYLPFCAPAMAQVSELDSEAAKRLQPRGGNFALSSREIPLKVRV